MSKSKKKQEEKPLPAVKWSEEEERERLKRLNSYSKEDEENLIQWLRDAEQIPDEGESVDEFLRRVGGKTPEEEDKEREATKKSRSKKSKKH